MQVRATVVGHYGLQIRNEGEVFTIHDEKLFSKVWMEKVGADETPARRASPKGKPDPKKTPKEIHEDTMEKSLESDSKGDVI